MERLDRRDGHERGRGPNQRQRRGDDGGFSGTVDTELADKLCTAWANFARTGAPSIGGVEWTTYDSTNRATMVIGNDSSMRMENDWLGAQRALVEPLLDLCVK